MIRLTSGQTRGIVLLTVLVLSGVAIAFAAGVAGGDESVTSDSAVGPDNSSLTGDDILGDVTQDGTVGLNDAILIQEEIAGVRDPDTPFFEPLADMNRDGDISLTDGILVQEKVAGVLEESEVEVSNLDAPATVDSGAEIDVSADLENIGDEGALEDVEFRIAPAGEPLDENATLDEQFVDMAAPGVEDPVDRPAETTVNFADLLVDLPAGEYEHGVFTADDNETATLTVEPGVAFDVSNLQAPGEVETDGLIDVSADITAFDPEAVDVTVVDSTFADGEAAALVDFLDAELDDTEFVVRSVTTDDLLDNTDRDVYVVNEFADADVGAFLDALDEDQAAIYLDQHGSGSDAVEALVEEREDPEAIESSSTTEEPTGAFGSELRIQADHPLFDGVGEVTDIVDIRGASLQLDNRAWFTGYSGETLGEISGRTSDDEAPLDADGPAVAVDDGANEVLLSSQGRTSSTNHGDYEDPENGIMLNAVEYAAFEQAGVEAPEEPADGEATQEITYEFEDDIEQTQNLTLSIGETETVTFDDVDLEGIPRGDYVHGIFSQDDGQTAPINVFEPVFFDVTGFEGPASTFQGDEVTVSANVTNTVPPGSDIGGDATATQTVEYRIGDQVLDSQDVTLDANENEIVTFEDVPVTTDVTAGDRIHGVFSGDANDTADVTVLPADAYLVDNLDPLNAELTQGDDPIDISVDVENLGGTTGEQDITLEIIDADGTVVFEDEIPGLELGPGEEVTETFEDVPAGDLPAGSYTHRVASDHDDIFGSLTVLEPVFFDVTDLDAPADVVQGEEITVSATVTNAQPPEPADVAVVDSEFADGQAGALADFLSDDLDGRFTVNEVESGDLLDEVTDNDVFVINEFGDTSADDFLSLLGDNQAAIYLDQLPVETDGVESLVDARGDPDEFNSQITDESINELHIEADHPIFEEVGGEGDVIEYQDFSFDVGFFEGYSGEVLGEIADQGDAPLGPAVGVDDDENEVLLSSSGRAPFTEQFTFTDEENQIMLNAVEYAATEQAGLSLPEAGAAAGIGTDATATQEIVYEFDGEVLDSEEVTLAAGESRTVTFEEVPITADFGVFEHGIASDDDGAFADIEVLEPVFFEVSELAAPAGIGQDDEITVTADVTNTVPATEVNVAVVDSTHSEFETGAVVDRLSEDLDDEFVVDEVFSEDLLDEVEEYEVFVVNEFADADAGAFLDTLDADQAALYLGQNEEFVDGSDALGVLADLREDIEFGGDFGEEPIEMSIDEEHPIFDGVGDEGDIVEYFDGFDFGFIEEGPYSGDVLGTINPGGVVEGGGVAISDAENEVLLPAAGRGDLATDASYLDAENQIMTNAVEYAAAEQAGVASAAVTPDATATQTVEYRLDGEVLDSEEVTLDAGESTTVEFTAEIGVDPGEYEHGVFTDDDNQTADLSVRAAAFNDQALGADAAGESAVLVEEVSADAGEAVAVTYTDDGDEIVAGLTPLAEDVDGEDIAVEIEDAGGFPGEHTAHVVLEPSDETAVGEPVSADTAASIATQRGAEVFDAEVSIADQSFEDGTTELTVETAALEPDAEFVVVIQEDTLAAPVLGVSEVQTGSVDELTVEVDELTTETDVAATLHFPEGTSDEAEGRFATTTADSEPVPVLDGEAFGTVTDFATVEILAAEGANLTFADQATASSSIFGDTTAGVVVEDIQEAELEPQDVTDPSEDFVVLFEGDAVDPDSIVAFERISEVDENGALVFDLSDEDVEPGEHTVEIHADNGEGEPDPEQPRGAAETATVFEGTIVFEDEVATEPIEEGDTLATIETADLLDGGDDSTAFVVDVHPTDEDGNLVAPEFVGASDVLSGANEDVEITAERVPDDGDENEFPIEATDDYVAMIHLVDDDAEPGEPSSPGEYPVLPNADAAEGFVPGGVTDAGEIEVETGELDGTVTNNETGDPIEDATVEVLAFGDEGPVVGNDTTDADGEYLISNLPAGEHTVEVSIDGSVVAQGTAVIESGETTTVDFALDPASFEVAIDEDSAGTNAGTAAGETQSFDVAVENVGQLSGTQTVELDWGDGAFTDSTAVTLGGGEETVETLTVTTDDEQPIAEYDVVVTSDDDDDTTTATIGPGRSLNQTAVAPGGAVEVTVSGFLGESATLNFADEWSPPAASAPEFETSFVTAIEGSSETDVFAGSEEEIEGSFDITYVIQVPEDPDEDTFEWQPLDDGDGSAVVVGGDAFQTFGDQQFEVTGGADTEEMPQSASLVAA